MEGADRLQRLLAQVPQRMLDAVRLELEKQAQATVDMMKRLAPKGESRALVNSIGWTWGDAPAGSFTVGTVRTPKGQSVQYHAMRITIYAGGGAAFYARFQEFGTKKMTANPFFFPAYRTRAKAVKAGLTRAMRKALKDG